MSGNKRGGPAKLPLSERNVFPVTFPASAGDVGPSASVAGAGARVRPVLPWEQRRAGRCGCGTHRLPMASLRARI